MIWLSFSEPASTRELIYLSHMGGIFSYGVQEIVGSKAGSADDDPDTGSVETGGEPLRHTS